MVIGISGKIGSGKDTVGNIVQYLSSGLDKTDVSFEEFVSRLPKLPTSYNSTFEVKKFADKLKDIVCMIIGCTREQLEDRDFKEKSLGKEWNKWKVIDNNPEVYSVYYYTTEEEARQSVTIDGENWLIYSPTIEEVEMTPRLMLQLLGTDCGRDIIHPQIWVNALFSEYNPRVTYQMEIFDLGASNQQREKIGKPVHDEYPNWIITDMRFPNELGAVKNNGGITIRINRPKNIPVIIFEEPADDEHKPRYVAGFDPYKPVVEHLSETALDDAKFDYVINNNGSIENLIHTVKEILIAENLL